jgi:cbb3-type cytochrome oxidase subunit 3
MNSKQLLYLQFTVAILTIIYMAYSIYLLAKRRREEVAKARA